jgi:hypothetical protein
VQGFVREQGDDMVAPLVVAGAAALMGPTTMSSLSYLKLDKLEMKVDQVQTSVDALSSCVDKRLDQFLQQATRDRWYTMCALALGGTALYMAAKPR